MTLVKPIWAAAFAVILFIAAACGGAGVATPRTPSGPGGSAATVTPSTAALPLASSSSRPASVAPSASPASPSSGSSASPTSGLPKVDLSRVDACSLLFEENVQSITGTSNEFATDPSDGEPTTTCFWAVPHPGEPAYVELTLEARPNGLNGYTGAASNWDCTIDEVAGIGSEAVGGHCIGSTQDKVVLTAWDKGLRVTLLVNEPEGGLEAKDLNSTAQDIFNQLVPDCDATFC